jgi:hypothetical protein
MKTPMLHRYVTLTRLGVVSVRFQGKGKTIGIELSDTQAQTLMTELHDALEAKEAERARMVETDAVVRHLRELS